MKKLFLIAALGVAGLMSANEVESSKVEAKANDENSEVVSVVKKIRLTVVTTCGETLSEVIDVPDNFTNADYIGVASIVNMMVCGENADSWEVNP